MVRRAFDDTYLLLSLALVVPVLLAELIADEPQLGPMALVGASFLAVQAWLARPRAGLLRRLASRERSVLRLLLALAFVALADVLMRDETFRPTALYLPIVATAAASGVLPAIGFGAIATAAYPRPCSKGPT
ncbi:MAG TPA: hypothetical protein VEO91_04490 [Candidatus Limnocylindria bacterium]|nr:hypothetical protein [Candidatus Limnocylindria bacterium]